MLSLLWLIPALPAMGFLILALAGRRLPRRAVPLVGVGSVGLSALVSLGVSASFLLYPPPAHRYVQTLGTWIDLPGFAPSITLYLDPLSLIMVAVITVVGAVIHLYSAEYMIDDDGYARFFSYMNLFVAAMLTLVLADNMLLLYVGWEGVGLCSYLLIGFWYRESENATAAVKAFITTRVGDTAMIVGIFLLYTHLGTLQIQELMQRAAAHWPVGSTLAVCAAALLLGGAVGKSAQLPLQTWLPDAMAGPTPVSALIHAATMVTAGVYLIARTHVLFTLAPAVQTAVAVIGVLTLLLAGFSALTQSDIKRALAYSTISQIGYMFLALGVGAWSAAMFHFFTHAFFKALLFLAAGAVIVSAHHEQNMFKLGGLRKELPVTFSTFLVGAAALASLPLVTSGFYSKDAVLWYAWASPTGSVLLWLGGAIGAFITAIYSFRMVFLTFCGELRTRVSHRPGPVMLVPLVFLAVGSLTVGFLELPHNLGHVQLFSRLLGPVLPSVVPVPAAADFELLLQAVAGVAAMVGIAIAYLLFLKGRTWLDGVESLGWALRLHRLSAAGWGFDRLYDVLFVRPFIAVARWNRNDFIDAVYRFIAEWAQYLHDSLSLTQTGRVRNYALAVGIGAVVAVGIVVIL